ncbi:MAG: DNA topoisomerase IB [Burkholderiales bacterium]|nr:DNA topoisomerase IB [Burkholderiales bacterium]
MPDSLEIVSQDAARRAGLRYVNDRTPGIRRRRSRGKNFTYSGVDGKTVKGAKTLARIKTLAIPPAWRDVWICALPDGHLQATGRDARGRKQYRYHAEWRATRSENNFSRMVAFGDALPRIRKQIEADLKLPGLPQAKVVAGIIKLLDATAIRVGNAEYARDNHSFGLTTMRRRHVEVNGKKIRFQFQGKSSKHHAVEFADHRIASIIRRCQELPGKELFNYFDEQGVARDISSDHVNQYLRDASGERFTAKDFRTWVGTVAASCVLSQLREEDSGGTTKQHFDTAVKAVALHMGNTPSVCRKYYIHPGLADAHRDQKLVCRGPANKKVWTGFSRAQRPATAEAARAAAKA